MTIRFDATGAIARIQRICDTLEIADPAEEPPALSPDEPGHPDYHHRQRVEHARRVLARVTPLRYRSATSDRPEVVAWVEAAVASWRSRATSEPVPVPSLLLYGPTGTGKTFAGFGALRRVAEAGLPRFGAEFASWPELLAQLRPGSGEEREQGLRRLMDAPWLLLDDLGRAKDSAWTEEILYRLVNHRYNVMLPTIITTNVPLKQFTAVFGDAPGGRLIEMTAGGRVAVTGEDRRLVR